MATRKAVRTSVRWTTASQSKTGTTRTTSRTTCTTSTPMTTLTQCTCTSTDAWRTTTCIEPARIFVPQLVMTPHGSSPERFHTPSMVIHMAQSPWFDLSTFYFFFFLLSVPVFLFHLELFPELLNTKCMANLRCSAAEESEDTLNAFQCSTRSIPVGERTWTDVEPGKQSLSDYPVSKKLIHLIRHGNLPREDDGAIEFWRRKDNLQKHFLYCNHWSDEVEEEHGRRRRTKEKISVLFWLFKNNFVCCRALQGHSGRSLIDPPLQDKVITPDGFFKYIYHVGCAINSHFIINSGLVPEDKFWATDGQYSFCLVDPMDKNHKDPDTIDLEAPRPARYMQKHGRNIKIQCVGSTSTLLWRKDWSSMKHDRTLSFFTKHSQLIVSRKLFGWKLERSCTRRKVYASPRPPPKISLKDDWMTDLGSEVARQPEGEVAWQAKSSQSSQPNPHPDHDWTVKPVLFPQRGAREASRSQEIETRSFREEAVRHDRTEKLVVCRDVNYERSMLNEVDIDYRILGLPHSVVKQAQNSRVRGPVKKIENHPHRQSLQRDLQQNEAYNPFSTTSKKMIQAMGNVELFELFETDPTTQCKECLLYWSEGIVCCTCGHPLKESAANRGVIQHTLDRWSCARRRSIAKIHFHKKFMQLFFCEGLISLCSYSFRREFKSL